MLTVGAIVVLLVHMQTVSRMAQMSLSGGDHRDMRKHLVAHAIGGLIVLLTTTVLSIYKPWGRTPYGRRLQLERAAATTRTAIPEGRAPRSRRNVLVAIIALLALMILLHLVGGFRGQ